MQLLGESGRWPSSALISMTDPRGSARERLSRTASTTTLAGIQHITMPHIDEHLKGIKDDFDRLNHELDETRRQRDEYITKCTS